MQMQGNRNIGGAVVVALMRGRVGPSNGMWEPARGSQEVCAWGHKNHVYCGCRPLLYLLLFRFL
jgi:hypothetical protein